MTGKEYLQICNEGAAEFAKEQMEVLEALEFDDKTLAKIREINERLLKQED